MIESSFSHNHTVSSISEHEVENLLKNENEFIGYKDMEERHLDITDSALRLFTKKVNCKKDVIGKIDFDVFHKNHWKIVELYHFHNISVYQKKIWHGIEPCHVDGKLVILEIIKKPVVNRFGAVNGSIYHAKQILNKIFCDSVLDLLQHVNPSEYNTNSHFEFYQNDNTVNLTAREKECLFYTLRGKTSKETAYLINVSPKTVEFHLEHLKNKFKCYSKSELISKAIELGYLEKIPKSIFLHSK